MSERAERYGWHGMENLLFPSYLTDLTTIDEDAIRLDIRNSIRHGFGAVAPVPGPNRTDYLRTLAITCEEAGDDITTTLFISSLDDLELMSTAEATSCGRVMLVITPDDEMDDDALYHTYRTCIDATALPICLYAGQLSRARSRVGPYGIPLRVFDRLAELPSVVAIKLTQPIPASAALEVADCLGDRLVLGPVNLELLPFLARHYPHTGWSGQWNVEAVQSPDRPYAVELIELYGAGKLDEALRLFEEFQPRHQAFYDLQATCVGRGQHPTLALKYHQWCTGGNGGLVRMPARPASVQPPLDAAARLAIRESYAEVGIPIRDAPDEEFLVGRAQYERGVRADDLELDLSEVYSAA